MRLCTWPTEDHKIPKCAFQVPRGTDFTTVSNTYTTRMSFTQQVYSCTRGISNDSKPSPTVETDSLLLGWKQRGPTFDFVYQDSVTKKQLPTSSLDLQQLFYGLHCSEDRRIQGKPRIRETCLWGYKHYIFLLFIILLLRLFHIWRFCFEFLEALKRLESFVVRYSIL